MPQYETKPGPLKNKVPYNVAQALMKDEKLSQGNIGDGQLDPLDLVKFLQDQIPQDTTDLAADLLPGGMISHAVGLIPKQFIQPFAKRLMGMIEHEKGWRPEVQQAAWEAVDRNPRIAANLDTIRPYDVERWPDDAQVSSDVLGDYIGMDKGGRENIAEAGKFDPGSLRSYLTQQLDRNEGVGLGAQIRLRPDRATYGSVFEPPSRVVDHEMTHAAQDIWNPGALGPHERYQTYDYNVNPFEIGANATADPMGGDYIKRLERALNARGVQEAMGSPERAKMLRDMNLTLGRQNRTVVLDPSSKMLKIVMNR